jgi:hypothetical protein
MRQMVNDTSQSTAFISCLQFFEKRAMSGQADDQAGGFIPQSLPSPAPSSSSNTSRQGSSLPHPRSKSLQPGSNKEDMVRRYVEERLQNTSRRYVKKFGNPEVGDDVVGYTSFSEVCKDLDSVVNVLWLSGTRKWKKYKYAPIA